MKDPAFNLKELQIVDGWTVIKNDFVDLEPDNDYPTHQVFYHFDEDILQATYKEYVIDLGFYGGYLDNNRNGFFKIVVFKEKLNFAEFFEIYISRSTDKIKNRLNLYFNAIPAGKLENLSGIRHDDNYDHNSFHIYSAIDNINFRLTDKEIEDISRPIKYNT